MQIARRNVALLSLAAIVVDVGGVSATAASGTHVSYGAAGVTIEAPGISGRQLLEEMSETVGFELRGASGIQERSVTLSLRDVTVDQGVRAVLRALGVGSHALIYDAGGDSLNTVVLLTGLAASAAPAPPVAVIPATESAPRSAVVTRSATPSSASPELTSRAEAARQRRAAAVERRAARRQERKERDPMEVISRIREKAAAKGLSGLKPSE